MSRTLRVNPIACTGHGACAELLPELIDRDEWGYPLITPGMVPKELERSARKAAAACPVLALRILTVRLRERRRGNPAPRLARYLLHGNGDDIGPAGPAQPSCWP